MERNVSHPQILKLYLRSRGTLDRLSTHLVILWHPSQSLYIKYNLILMPWSWYWHKTFSQSIFISYWCFWEKRVLQMSKHIFEMFYSTTFYAFKVMILVVALKVSYFWSIFQDVFINYLRSTFLQDTKH